MRDYFIRRLLLIPPTLLGVTLLVFTITRFVPGGPMEREREMPCRKPKKRPREVARRVAKSEEG